MPRRQTLLPYEKQPFVALEGENACGGVQQGIDHLGLLLASVRRMPVCPCSDLRQCF
jgi:hypothetical protein